MRLITTEPYSLIIGQVLDGDDTVYEVLSAASDANIVVVKGFGDLPDGAFRYHTWSEMDIDTRN